MIQRYRRTLLLIVAGMLAACGGGSSGPTQLAESWIRASGTDAARGAINFAANAFVIIIGGRQVASAADTTGLGFSLSVNPDQVTTGTDYDRLLGLTYRTKAGNAGAITPITGGLVRFSSIGASAGEPIEGTFTLDVDRPESENFARIVMQVTGSFRFLRR